MSLAQICNHIKSIFYFTKEEGRTTKRKRLKKLSRKVVYWNTEKGLFILFGELE